MNEGDIYLTRFYFTSKIEYKERPTLIIKKISDVDYLCLPLTTKLEKEGLIITSQDLSKGYLNKTSILVCKFETLNSNLFIKYIATLNNDSIIKVKNFYCESLNCCSQNKIKYSIIAAVADNFAIGNNQKIPWHISEDFKLFKERTLNNVIIMGKNTWDSLPIKPLPNRINIVLNTEQIELNDAIVATSLDEAFNEASKYTDKEIFVIGGAFVYNQTIEDATYLYISHVKGNFEGNVFFPQFDKNKYKIIEEKEYDKFIFKKYEKILLSL